MGMRSLGMKPLLIDAERGDVHPVRRQVIERADSGCHRRGGAHDLRASIERARHQLAILQGVVSNSLRVMNVGEVMNGDHFGGVPGRR